MSFKAPLKGKDALTEVLLEGARKMLDQAIGAEVDELLCAHRTVPDAWICRMPSSRKYNSKVC